MIPVIGVYAGAEEGFVRVHVWLGEGAAVVGAPVVTQAFSADADAEMTAVYAIMALHEGDLVAPESQGAVVHYVLQFSRRRLRRAADAPRSSLMRSWTAGAGGAGGPARSRPTGCGAPRAAAGATRRPSTRCAPASSATATASSTARPSAGSSTRPRSS